MENVDMPQTKGRARPEFFTMTRKNETKSANEGRPIYDEINMVRIIIPGDAKTVAEQTVRDHHKQRWPREWEAFQKGQAAPISGMPLKEWSRSTPKMVAELNAQNIFTVEDLASVSDVNLGRLGMGGRQLRDQAKAFIDAAKGTYDAAQHAEELKKRDDQIAVLQQQVQALMDRDGSVPIRMEQPHANNLQDMATESEFGDSVPAKRRPGRPRKDP